MEKLYRIQVDIAPALPPTLNGDPQVLAPERYYLTLKFLKDVEDLCDIRTGGTRVCKKRRRDNGTRDEDVWGGAYEIHQNGYRVGTARR